MSYRIDKTQTRNKPFQVNENKKKVPKGKNKQTMRNEQKATLAWHTHSTEHIGCDIVIISQTTYKVFPAVGIRTRRDLFSWHLPTLQPVYLDWVSGLEFKGGRNTA
ncbi:hypothetical protein ElyMa_002265500 [Elysia marginata]|uniref:Plastocyanin-like domain-containing protein n=1 Tax=Elysia marginata TaxID=1093978 RepID=A0AAV4FZB6_9GAST|nr:hypothetical protein ElyMa_002265500 [Elysia marginata]